MRITVLQWLSEAVTSAPGLSGCHPPGRVVVAPQAFKGTIPATSASAWISDAVRAQHTGAVVRVLPFTGDKDPIERYDDGEPAAH